MHGLFTSLPNQTGYCIRSKYILEGQKRLGINCLAITPPMHKSLFEVETINGIEYYRTKKSMKFFYNVPFLKHVVNMKDFYNGANEIVNKLDIDLIHAHSPFFVASPLLRVAKENNIPFIYEVRGFWEESAISKGSFKKNSLKYKIYKKNENFVLSNSDAIVSICNGIKKEIENRNLNLNDVYVIPNGIDDNIFNSNVNKQESNILRKRLSLENSKVVGYISYFRKMEGIEYLIEAFKYIKKDNIKLLLIGDGPEYNNLVKITNKYNLNKKVIFTGRIPHDDIKYYYDLLDVFVVPRIDEKVTNLVTPLKPLEAMIMKKAIIGSDVGGIKEIVKDGETGLLFKCENSEDLSHKIIYLIENDKIRHQIAENAYKWVVEKRLWNNIIPKYYDLYNFIISKKGN